MILKRARQTLAGAGVVGFLIALASLLYGGAIPETYEVVISQGRVMDPESGLEAIRDLGISGGKIRAISADPLSGTLILQLVQKYFDAGAEVSTLFEREDIFKCFARFLDAGQRLHSFV